MEKSKIDMFMMTNSKYLPAETLYSVKEALEKLPDENSLYLHSVQLKDPNTAMVLSLVGLLGIAGLDRFYIGDIGLGIAKLLTVGACYIWTIVDLFTITKKTKEQNYNNLMTVLM